MKINRITIFFLMILNGSCFLFDNRNLDKQQQVLLTHGDSITDVGSRLKICAVSASQVIAGIWNGESIFGVQFHPEVSERFFLFLFLFQYLT